jgi:hypothetical protein
MKLIFPILEFIRYLLNFIDHLPSTMCFFDILLSFAATQRAFNQTENLSIDLTEIRKYVCLGGTKYVLFIISMSSVSRGLTSSFS